MGESPHQTVPTGEDGRFTLYAAADEEGPLSIRVHFGIRGQPPRNAVLEEVRPGQTGIRIVLEAP